MIDQSNLLFFGCLLLLCLQLCFDGGNSSFTGYYCPNDSWYNVNSNSGRIYKTNLNFLLATLTSNASQPNGFYSFTAGSTYGLFLCRGDIKASACKECVAAAGTQSLLQCPDHKGVTVWYDSCMLRYSNQPNLSSGVDVNIFLKLTNPQNVTEFIQVLGNTLSLILNKAANDLSGKKFAVGEANYSTSGRIFALAQCTPDLSSTDCATCLWAGISLLPTYAKGGRVLFLRCNIRYEMYLFYEISTPPPEPKYSLPPPPLGSASSQHNGKISKRTTVAVAVPIFLAIVLFVVVFFCIARGSRKTDNVKAETSVSTTSPSGMTTGAEALHYDFTEIQAFTNNFAIDNRIGEGGFGPVYKGTLPNGLRIAVKRLSKSSTQGAEEFINEIVLVAKLQHRNLARLLGYCLEGEEKLLIYEFVPNKSLDYFLFDPEKQPLLNWSTRYKILGGIARGLLYLHEDSQLKVVHRDLKASNVLLDRKMNPKVADFGLARLFVADQTEENTSKIAGTLGYMPPEYALRGLLSVKLDVFSFGVLVLEIVSGKKNSSFLELHGAHYNLSSYAWRQWRDGTALELVDPSIQDSYVRNEVIQCIHIGLLCVQDDAEQRPTMASVALMLNSSSVTLPTPKPPGFYVRSRNQSFPENLPNMAESDKSSTTENVANTAESVEKIVPDFSINEASVNRGPKDGLLRACIVSVAASMVSGLEIIIKSIQSPFPLT